MYDGEMEGTFTMYTVLLALVCSILSGVAMGYATYSVSLPFVALVAWVPAVVAQHTLWPARWRGAGMGITWFVYLSIAFAPMLAPEIGPWAWALPFGVGLIVTLVDQAAVHKAQDTGYRLFWWQQAVSCTAVELGRSYIPAVATWTMAGYGLTAGGHWRFAASKVGITGLSLAVWACNFAVAYVVLVLLKAAPWRRVTGPAAVGVVVVCLALSALPESPPLSMATLRVAAIQPGFDLDQVPWGYSSVPENQVELSQRLLPIGAQLTREATGKGARLVVWPEGFLRIVPQDEPVFRTALETLSRETSAALAVGYVVETPEGRRNEVALITPEGEWAITAKDHPVPWAETGSVTQGQVATVMVDGYKVGAMICYDADFTDTVRRRASERVHLLVAPAHDWPAMAEARSRHIQTRAAENHLPILMADWRVGSVAVDADGRLLKSMPMRTPTRGVMIADIPLTGTPGSPYTGLGDLTGWSAIAVLALAAVVEGRLLRQSRRTTAA
jgi:apolipoprotein N-acyltransferase